MAGRRDIDRLQDEIEDLFHDLWRVPRFAGMRRGFRPQVDCFRTEEPPELVVLVELPGVEPSDLHLAVADRTLVIAGERRRPAGEARRSFYQMEIEDGPFQRRLALPDEIDTSRASASYERGLLRIVFPIQAKPAPTGPVSIPVRSGA